MNIERYTPEHSHEWDEHVSHSRNGTFLHQRGYMDYHRDRFTDHSLMARDSRGRLVAVMPACEDDDTLWSHKGLTFGGWIMHPNRCDADVMLSIMELTLKHLKSEGFKHLVYKTVPHIYHRPFADDDQHALCRMGARWTESNVSSCIDLSNPLPFDRGNRANVNRARRSGVAVDIDSNGVLHDFWHVLEDVLRNNHKTAPVHTLSEIQMLQNRFPDNIRLHTATLDGKVVAGVVIYLSNDVAHCQYIASSPDGRENKALALLFHDLVEHYRRQGCRWFDMGTSNECHGEVLNTSLMEQKNRFGGRAVAYNIFTLDV